MKIKLKVVQCNPNQTGGFVLKLEVNEEAKVFGMVKNVKRTYYIGGMPQAVAVDTVFEEEMSHFNIDELPYEIINDNNEKEVIYLKWLRVKPTFERA
jgi:hypothetical protein